MVLSTYHNYAYANRTGITDVHVTIVPYTYNTYYTFGEKNSRILTNFIT